MYMKSNYLLFRNFTAKALSYGIKFVFIAVSFSILTVFTSCASASTSTAQKSPDESAKPAAEVKTHKPVQSAVTAEAKTNEQVQVAAAAGITPPERAQPAVATEVKTKTQEPVQPAVKAEVKAAKPDKPATAPEKKSEPAPQQPASTVAQTKVAEPAKEAAKEPAAEAKKPSLILDPKDPKSILYYNTKGELAGTGDPAKSGSPSASYRAGAAWHPPTLASDVLPKDKYGLVNWAKAVKDNLITPRASFDPDDEEMIMDMNVLIETKSDFINNVVYPHYIHTWWLPCTVCHPKIFIPSRGQNNMSMTKIADGQFCGRCHGKVAFPLTDCTRCHVLPKGKPAPESGK